MSKSNIVDDGIGFFVLLTIAFIVLLVLKLTNVIDLSWWLVISPVLFPIALLLIILVAVAIAEHKNF